MSAFAALLAASGLSQVEAGRLLSVNGETLRSWVRGKSRTPSRVLSWAHETVAEMMVKANALVNAYENLARTHGTSNAIEIAISTDDHEAQANGFLMLSHERATIGLALAQLPSDAVRLMPRGSTFATAAAERARL